MSSQPLPGPVTPAQPLPPVRSENALSVKEVSQILRCDPRVLAAWVKLGVGPPCYWLPGNRSMRFRLSAVIGWLETLEREGRTAPRLAGNGEASADAGPGE